MTTDQEPLFRPFDDALPYASQREPVYAGDVVATSQPLAAQAGLEMLRRGGNAVDAAIASAAALTVVEPTSNGLGGDAFALVWAGGGLHGFNGSGKSAAMFDASNFAGMNEIPPMGWGGVTTPGAVSLWGRLRERFGTLPMSVLLAPAVRYARDGYLVGPQTAFYWNRADERYPREPMFDPWRRVFTPIGRAPRAGERWRSEDHATTLERIADSDGRDFYQGQLAERISAEASRAYEQGDRRAALRSADLASHTMQEVRPITLDYRGYRFHQIPPNGQGLCALIAAGILKQFDLASMQPDSADWLHVQIEAMKLAFADAHAHIADEDHMRVSLSDLLDEGYLASRAAMIDRDRAQDFNHGQPKPGGTVYLCTADRSGMMVSFIQSNYMGFGSGVVVPGTGIALHNRGCNFSLDSNHPNAAAPGKRPYHTIIPGFVTRTDERGVERPVMAFGVMGGFMQPQGHVQVLVRIADHNQNPQAALDAPRFRVDRGLKVAIEPGFAADVYETLTGMGHDVTKADDRTVSFGRGQIAWRLGGDANGYLAASDARSEGQAVGF